MLHTLPAVVTHNFNPRRGAFRNVCGLPPADAERLIAQIRAEGGSCRRADYLDCRLRTEEWLIAERFRKLGPTPLERPAYFFLGDMADGLDRSRPPSVVLPLAGFDPGVLTFTFPDSMASCPRLRGPDRSAKPYHGQVFTLSEITDIVARHGFPDPRTPPERRGPDSFIEVQVWDGRPLAASLGRGSTRGPSPEP